MANERFEWYYAGESGQIGPLTESQLLDLADHAVLKRDTLVWKVGMASWTPAESIPLLASRLRPEWSPPPLATPPPMPEAGRAAPAGGAPCPRDGHALRRDSRSGVEIDWCPACKGVWLDRGELEKLLSREADYGGYRDDDDDRYRGKKKRGLLGDVFDIFD